MRAMTATALGVDPSQLTVTPAEIGGGFGGKTTIYLEPLARVLVQHRWQFHRHGEHQRRRQRQRHHRFARHRWQPSIHGTVCRRGVRHRCRPHLGQDRRHTTDWIQRRYGRKPSHLGNGFCRYRLLPGHQTRPVPPGRQNLGLRDRRCRVGRWTGPTCQRHRDAAVTWRPCRQSTTNWWADLGDQVQQRPRRWRRIHDAASKVRRLPSTEKSCPTRSTRTFPLVPRSISWPHSLGADMAVAVPQTAADVTLEWFDAALVEGGVLDVDLAGLTVEPLSPDQGLLGDLSRLHVTYRRGSGPASFILKLPAAAVESRRIGTMLGAYAREVAFYRHVAPRAQTTRLAQCYYTGEDTSSERWAVVLDDLPTDRIDGLAGATTAQAAAAVDALADFHGHWWQQPDQAEWMPGFHAGGVGGLQPMWMESLPHFVTRFRALIPEPTHEWVLTFAPQLAEWSNRAAQEPLTMVHADYRLDNLLFDGDQVTIIDWQTTMWAPAAMDLTCFLTTSLAVDARRTVEEGLIDRYLARLAHHEVSVDPEWFRRSYDENVLWWMGQFGNNLAHLRPEDPAVQANLDAMITRVFTAGLDRDVGRLL
ncbi:hypothetical protein GQR58_028489 [Nymphon striatum]|nr:hypothetical protein GQR58_028489 [Nymphon striatum]